MCCLAFTSPKVFRMYVNIGHLVRAHQSGFIYITYFHPIQFFNTRFSFSYTHQTNEMDCFASNKHHDSKMKVPGKTPIVFRNLSCTKTMMASGGLLPSKSYSTCGTFSPHTMNECNSNVCIFIFLELKHPMVFGITVISLHNHGGWSHLKPC